jgi:hypothetical protein
MKKPGENPVLPPGKPVFTAVKQPPPQQAQTKGNNPTTVGSLAASQSSGFSFTPSFSFSNAGSQPAFGVGASGKVATGGTGGGLFGSPPVFGGGTSGKGATGGIGGGAVFGSGGAMFGSKSPPSFGSASKSQAGSTVVQSPLREEGRCMVGLRLCYRKIFLIRCKSGDRFYKTLNYVLRTRFAV